MQRVRNMDIHNLVLCKVEESQCSEFQLFLISKAPTEHMCSKCFRNTNCQKHIAIKGQAIAVTLH